RLTADLLQHEREWMHRSQPRSVGNLVPAGKSRGDGRPRLALADRGEKHPVSDRLADVIGVISKRPGHAATSGIDFADREARNQSQSTFRPRRYHEGLLLAMSVKERCRIEPFEFELHFAG